MSAATNAAPELAGLRILLVHQWLYTWAGAERDLEQLLVLMPHADVLAGIVTPRMREQHDVARRATETWVGRIPHARAHHRWLLPLQAIAFQTYDTSQYDLIVSVSHAFEKSVRARGDGAIHVCYCLSPPRYLWDLDVDHDAYANPLQRLALRTMRSTLRRVDLSGARRVHHFVSQSRYVADRVRRWYSRDSAVVYPPATPKPMAGDARRETFLFTMGRLVPYKRVDLAIAAAERLGIQLIVAGDGPDRARLERLASRGATFLGEVSESEAGRLLSTCAAFLFCADEDFGIVPIEANAAGAPVVAYARGGALETLQEGRSAVFFSELTVESVASAIRRCLARSWDRDILVRNAARFGPQQFRDGMRREIIRALELHR